MKLLTLIALILFSTSLVASPLLKKEFTDTFVSHYVNNKCGQNIMNLVRRASGKGVDMSKAKIIKLTGGGYIMQALFARNEGTRLPSPIGDIVFSPGVSPMYFHVVLEKDGLIYDFDYGNQPTVVPVKKYLEKMWLEIPANTGGTIVDKLPYRLKSYEVNLLSAQQYLDDVRFPEDRILSLNDFYHSLR